MTRISGHSFSILGDPGAVRKCCVDRIQTLTAPLGLQGCPFRFQERRESLLSRLYERMTSSFLLKFKMADGEYCNECFKNCCLYKGCIYSFFFKVKVDRSVSHFMLFFGIRFQIPPRKRAGKCPQSTEAC